MPSIRTDKQIFPFFDSVKTPVSTAGTSEAFRNNGFETLILEVSGATSISLTVEGCINIIKPNGETMTDEECSWTPLAIINMTGFEVLSEITSNGIYAIGINGNARVRTVIDSIEGEAVITGVAEA